MTSGRSAKPQALASFVPDRIAADGPQGEAGTGNVVEAVRHTRAVMGAIRQLATMDEDELYVYAKELRAPIELVRKTKHLGRLPVINFAAGVPSPCKGLGYGAELCPHWMP